jgi:hypothetical protein
MAEDSVGPGGALDAAAAAVDGDRRLLARHPQAAVIWAHTGLGRFVPPGDSHVKLLAAMLADARFGHVLLDLSWDEVARYIVEPGRVQAWADLINTHPTRFLFGTDAMAPLNWQGYARTHAMYQPLWERLDAETRAQVERLNYERVFDTAAARVRAWEESSTDR